MRDAIDQRQAGGWEGAPVQENSPLDANHHLLELKHSFEGVWIYDSLEMTSGRREAIALAVEPPAREQLLKAVKRQPEGACVTQSTEVHAICSPCCLPAMRRNGSTACYAADPCGRRGELEKPLVQPPRSRYQPNCCTAKETSATHSLLGLPR